MESKFKCEGCDYISQIKTNFKRHIENCKVLKHSKIILLENQNLVQNNQLLILENKVNELTNKNNLFEQSQEMHLEQIMKLNIELTNKNNLLEQNQGVHLEQMVKFNNILNQNVVLQNQNDELKKHINKQDKMIERLENRLEEKDKRKENELTKTREQYDKIISSISTNQKDMFALIKNEGNKLIQTNSHNSTINNNNTIYVLNQYEPPVIQSIDKVINLDNELTRCINVLGYWNKEKVVHKRLGDIIIKNYKKDDMGQQNIWCSDINRFTYFIRTVLNEENDEETDASEGSDVKEIWYQDKGGVEVSKYVIKPLLECLDDVLTKWMTNIGAFPNVNIAQVIGTIGDIRNSINTHKLEKQIFKYISSHFSLERIKINKEKATLTIVGANNEESDNEESNNEESDNEESDNEDNEDGDN